MYNIKLLDVIGSIIHGAKISRGNNREKIIRNLLRNDSRFDKVLDKAKKFSLPLGYNKTNSHSVDIVAINHHNKEIFLIDSKSDGINHNTMPENDVEIQKLVNADAAKKWPGYKITPVFLRPSGEDIKAYTNAGFHTYKTNNWVNADVSELEYRFYTNKIDANKNKFCRKSNISENEWRRIDIMMKLAEDKYIPANILDQIEKLIEQQ